MRIAGAFLLIVGIALALFELPMALSPRGDVGHGWAVVGMMLATILVALGAMLMVLSLLRRPRPKRAGQ
ncbi:hypothetical protein [Phenylobacterium kunshanense]|uniref:Uncharacterized protein n=1 Tax=Phenylobacterium kunshanense TaxID=1445034 RepID=A0A328BT14_9CAUL|nr:hypothetical protein [Phenylobacterium kunshanense]RAK68994.1 hypothetical protein DJ019_03015 [Phenylobacterium kunshanense]